MDPAQQTQLHYYASFQQQQQQYYRSQPPPPPPPPLPQDPPPPPPISDDIEPVSFPHEPFKPEKRESLFNRKPLDWSENIIDTQLPAELKSLFQPLYCKLCTLTLTSPVVAKDHYMGKKHKQKTKAWMEQKTAASNQQQQIVSKDVTTISPTPVPDQKNISAVVKKVPPPTPPVDQCSWTTGAPIPQQPLSTLTFPIYSQHSNVTQKQSNNGKKNVQSDNTVKRRIEDTFTPDDADIISPVKKSKKKKGTGGNFAYCQFCNLTLTSQIHADQHNAGKKHREVVNRARKTGAFGDMDRNFGIGTSFTANVDNDTTISSGGTTPPHP